MKTIHVACAIIIKDEMVLCAQRSSKMAHPFYWEFPGGKIEDNESGEQAIIREIEEELNCIITVEKSLPQFFHSYTDKNIVLYPFICKIINGTPQAIEHSQIKWIDLNTLLNINWLNADIPIVKYFIKNNS